MTRGILTKIDDKVRLAIEDLLVDALDRRVILAQTHIHEQVLNTLCDDDPQVVAQVTRNLLNSHWFRMKETAHINVVSEPRFLRSKLPKT